MICTSLGGCPGPPENKDGTRPTYCFMIIDVEDIRRQNGLKMSIRLEGEEIGAKETARNRISGISGELEMTNTGKFMLLTGSVKGFLVMPCSRCLREYRQEISAEITEKFLRVESRPGGEKGEQAGRRPRKGKSKTGKSEQDNEDIFFYSGGKIDITEALRQNLLVNAPYAPVCSPDCKGLCGTCGADLNEGPCGCAP